MKQSRRGYVPAAAVMLVLALAATAMAGVCRLSLQKAGTPLQSR